ncbi:MAG TPA: hypothetical protein VEI49_01055 [Terriglobales bacterium]|nr:hypothetical protein [Terriglobales bacterium]
MTASSISMPLAAIRPAEQTHRRLIELISIIWIVVFVAVTLFGMSYYRLSKTDRAFSPKHHLLRPSGTIGISLAFLGVIMLCGIFLYPLRKRWRWLQRQGDSKHWLDHHIVFGIVAPISIAFHSAFRFHGLAGLAFWLMVAVSVSGLIGRYLYAQVLREVAAAESSLFMFRAMLERQTLVSQEDLRRLFFPIPPANRVSRWSAFTALGYLALSDLTLQVRVVRLRARVLGIGFRSLGGLLFTGNAELEHVISLACKEARLSRRLLLLSHAQRIFRLWHFVHKPFSYAFLVLALAHIGVAMIFGFI